MNKLIQWLTKPFEKDFLYFILIFIFITAIDIYDFSSRGLLPYTIYLFFHGYVVSYLLCLLGKSLPSLLSTIYKFILAIIGIFLFIADLLSFQIYHQRFNQDFAAIIMQTNPAEIGEFFETFISWKLTFYIILTFLLFGGSYYAAKKTLPPIPKSLQTIALAVALIGTFLTIRNPLMYKDAFIGRLVAIFQTPTIPDLKEFLTHPQITVTKPKQPRHVMMIIGESFSKSHSSLYGYNKITNPYLSELRDSSYLHIYKKVQTPALHTLAAIQCIMSTYKPEYKDSIPWYKCTSIPEAIQLSGYHTHWISNQSKIGIFDTGTGRYADLCNDQHFVGDKFAGMRRTNLDEEVIPLIQPFLQDSLNHHFYFVQLMGSHSNFKSRYPESFDKFKPKDYLKHPEHQRNNLATYDNSILYNDSVVYEIMQLFQHKEAIIFYLSDHAIDVYESSDTYIAHANNQDPRSVEAGSRIPFMIYTSPLYQQNFPDEMEQIKQCTEQPFRTDDMIYTIMDIVGTALKGESLDGKSLFRLKR